MNDSPDWWDATIQMSYNEVAQLKIMFTNEIKYMKFCVTECLIQKAVTTSW